MYYIILHYIWLTLGHDDVSLGSLLHPEKHNRRVSNTKYFAGVKTLNTQPFKVSSKRPIVIS